MSGPAKKALTLKQFMVRVRHQDPRLMPFVSAVLDTLFQVRQEVLKLYRTFFRTIRHLPDERQKSEVADWVRSDFKTHKTISVEDEVTIKNLLFNGEKMLRELKQSVDLSKA